jgi:V8-like Glu-specific endopeptidase
LKIIFNILFILFFPTHGNSTPQNEKVVYGQNNLIDFYQLQNSYPPELKTWSRSVAALFSKERLQKKETHYHINFSTVTEDEVFCQPKDPLETIFSSQPDLSDCTGFLIGPDILATAGHCMETQERCADSLWVFDYKLEGPNQVFSKFPEKNVYECEKLISEDHPFLDYAFLKLKKVPLNRKPLKVRSLSDGDISGHPNLVVMGFPLGRPLKLSLQTTLKNTSKPEIFSIESDTFKGNSGSPVINIQKGWVEGILFSGEADFTYKNHCQKIKYCEIGTCRGEEAVRINQIPEISKWIKHL